MVNLKQIEAFVAVADLGTFRRAAAQLNTTQPNISARIAQLEARLGTSLMDRDAGSVRLTAKGGAMLPAARAVLAALDSFVAAADDAALFQGALRLGVSELVAHTWLRPFLMQMRQLFPNIRIELTVDLSANLSRALFARDLDLVFQNGPFDRHAKGEFPLGQSPYVWVAPPDIALPDRALTPQDLAAHPILTHARGTDPYRQLDAHFRAEKVAAQLVPSANIGTCLQMTQDGLGIACLPRAMLTAQLASGRLRALDYHWLPAPLRFAARHDSDPAPPWLLAAARIAQALSPPEDNQS